MAAFPLQRFIDEQLPPLIEVALAASALTELRHGTRSTGVEAQALKRLVLIGRRCQRSASGRSLTGGNNYD
jgi:hypothetical protein